MLLYTLKSGPGEPFLMSVSCEGQQVELYLSAVLAG